MKKILYAISISTLFLINCETIVDINIPVEPPKLVINSTLSDGEYMKVNISESQHILDETDYRKVEGATVEIYTNGTLLTTLPDSLDGNYISSSYKPLRGNNYQIKVTKSGFESINAQVLMPLDTANILTVTLDSIEINEFDYAYETLKFSVEIEDNGSTPNFYEIAIYLEYYDYSFNYDVDPPVVIDSFYRFQPLFIESLDPSLEDYQSFGESILFNDELFNGHQYTMNVLSNSFYYFEDPNFTFNPTFYAVLNNTSESYYLYRLSSQLQSWTVDNPFAQPVTVYNNIENGFGVFGAYNTAMVKVE